MATFNCLSKVNLKYTPLATMYLSILAKHGYNPNLWRCCFNGKLKVMPYDKGQPLFTAGIGKYSLANTCYKRLTLLFNSNNYGGVYGVRELHLRNKRGNTVAIVGSKHMGYTVINPATYGEPCVSSGVGVLPLLKHKLSN